MAIATNHLLVAGKRKAFKRNFFDLLKRLFLYLRKQIFKPFIFGLYLQKFALRLQSYSLGEAEPEIQHGILGAGPLDEGQRGTVPSGDQGPPQTAGPERPPSHYLPCPGAQPETERGPPPH